MERIDPHAWCFLSGRICALENNLLRKDFFEHLLPLEESAKADLSEARPKEILTCLKESPLREDFLTPEDVLNFEGILQHRFFRLLHEVKELSPTPGVWELLQTRYDLINLKNFLKEKLTGLKRPSPSASGGLPPFPSPYEDETWEALWGGHEVPFRDGASALYEMDIPEGFGRELSRNGLSPRLFVWPTWIYQKAIKTLKEHLGEISINPGILDLVLDWTYLSGLPQLAERTSSPFIVNYYLEYQKLAGILFLWRAGKDPLRYIPRPWFTPALTLPLHGEGRKGDWEKTLKEALPERIISELQLEMVHESPLPRYEKAVENTLMERLASARFFVFGPERVFGYLKGLEAETLNLRLAIGGRLQGVPPEDISRRLRKSYV